MIINYLSLIIFMYLIELVFYINFIIIIFFIKNSWELFLISIVYYSQREARGSVTFKILPSYRIAPPPCEVQVSPGKKEKNKMIYIIYFLNIKTNHLYKSTAIRDKFFHL